MAMKDILSNFIPGPPEFGEPITGDHIIEHKGRYYPVSREQLHGYADSAANLGHRMMMRALGVHCAENAFRSKQAYIYHNAAAAGVTCLGEIEKRKTPE